MSRVATSRRRRVTRTAWRVAGIALAALLGMAVTAALVIGLVGAVAAIVVALVVVAGPWLVVGFTGYQLVRLWTRRRRDTGPDPRRHPRRAAAPAAAGPVPLSATAADPLARLPHDQRAQVERIRSKALGLLHQAGRFPTGSRSLYLVRRTLDEYLPSTLDSYLALPAGADGWPVSPDGRTGLQVLHDQLHLLETKLDEIAGDLWRADVQRVLANERFLTEHFGGQPGHLRVSG